MHARGAWLGGRAVRFEGMLRVVAVSTTALQPCSCAPHPCGATGKGNRSRHKAMSMRSGGRAEPASLGMALSRGCVWPGLRTQHMAWAGGCDVGNSLSRKWVEQVRELPTLALFATCSGKSQCAAHTHRFVHRAKNSTDMLQSCQGPTKHV